MIKISAAHELTNDDCNKEKTKPKILGSNNRSDNVSEAQNGGEVISECWFRFESPNRSEGFGLKVEKQQYFTCHYKVKEKAAHGER